MVISRKTDGKVDQGQDAMSVEELGMAQFQSAGELREEDSTGARSDFRSC